MKNTNLSRISYPATPLREVVYPEPIVPESNPIGLRPHIKEMIAAAVKSGQVDSVEIVVATFNLTGTQHK